MPRSKEKRCIWTILWPTVGLGAIAQPTSFFVSVEVLVKTCQGSGHVDTARPCSDGRRAKGAIVVARLRLDAPVVIPPTKECPLLTINVKQQQKQAGNQNKQNKQPGPLQGAGVGSCHAPKERRQQCFRSDSGFAALAERRVCGGFLEVRDSTDSTESKKDTASRRGAFGRCADARAFEKT